jgi:putative transcriptional regulator
MPLTREHKKALEALANRVRELRKEKELSQMALGRSIGKDRQSIHRLEAGVVNPGYIFLLEICEGLETEPSTLFKNLSI